MSDESTPHPIDFSALDPCRDQVRWARAIDDLAARALAERRKRLSVEHQLLSWARPVLAVAAVFCLMVWTAGYFMSSRRSATTSPMGTVPALQIAAWAANNSIPDTSELSGTLGGNP
jgi:hypothetical protein